MKTLKTLSISVLIIIVFAIIAVIIGVNRNSAAESSPVSDSGSGSEEKASAVSVAAAPKTDSLEPAELTMGTGEEYRLNGADYSCDETACSRLTAIRAS